jgi:hypothetical protein
MKKNPVSSKFLVWLREPAARTAQIIVEAKDENEATNIALQSVAADDWDEQEVEEVYAEDVCRLDSDGNIDQERIYELARRRGYTVQ